MSLAGMILNEEEVDMVRQWFDAVQDLNADYLMIHDYELAQKTYKQLGMRVPLSISENANSVPK